MPYRFMEYRRAVFAAIAVCVLLVGSAVRWGVTQYQLSQERAEYARRQQAHIDNQRAEYLSRRDDLHTQAKEHFMNGDADFAVGVLKGFEGFLDGEVLALYKLAREQAPAVSQRREAVASAEESARAAARIANAEAACRANLQCWAKRHEVEAQVACAPVVERVAKYQFEWTDGFMERRFEPVAFGDTGNNVVWGGDKVKFQNGFGAWQVMVYACEFDPSTNTAVDVAVKPRG